MSQRAATITSVPMAFEVVKAMQAEGLDWGEGYPPSAGKPCRRSSKIRWPRRTRHYSRTAVIRAYARRTREIDRVILAGFVVRLSTREVGETLLALLGRSVSPSTVSQVAKTLDAAVAAFHRRPLHNRYQALMLDGVVLSRKTGAGALRRPILVALGLRHAGKKEIIDFRLAASESAAEWEKFLADGAIAQSRNL
jgi:putative transposase